MGKNKVMGKWKQHVIKHNNLLHKEDGPALWLVDELGVTRMKQWYLQGEIQQEEEYDESGAIFRSAFYENRQLCKEIFHHGELVCNISEYKNGYKVFETYFDRDGNQTKEYFFSGYPLLNEFQK